MDLKLKCILGVAIAIVSFVSIDGVQTYRRNHQIHFAHRVQKKIGIETIKVRVEKDVLILEGVASVPQIKYAEKVTKAFMEKHAPRATNPPKSVVNQLKSKRLNKDLVAAAKGERDVASETH